MQLESKLRMLVAPQLAIAILFIGFHSVTAITALVVFMCMCSSWGKWIAVECDGQQ